MTSENPIVISRDQDHEDVLRSMLCCTGDDHTIESGGPGWNIVETDYRAEWTFLVLFNALLTESKDYPLASAVVCDRCIDSQSELPGCKYVLAGDPGPDENSHYWRVPVSELLKVYPYHPSVRPDARQPEN